MRFFPFLLFVVGTLLGIGLTLLLLPSVEPLESPVTALPPPADASEELKQLRLLLDRKEAALAEQYAEIQKLEEALESARTAQTNAETLLRLRTPRDEDTTREERQATRAARYNQALQREAERRASDLTDRLGLSSSQADAIRVLFEKQAEYRLAAGMARSNEEAPPPWEGPPLETALAQILSPEQYTAYQEYETAVQTSRAETGATARMNRIAPELGLDEAQKDQVFSLFYEDLVTRMQLDASPGQVIPPADIQTRMQQVLTAEQYERWQSLETDRRRRGPPGFP
jgi:hypothetical protein